MFLETFCYNLEATPEGFGGYVQCKRMWKQMSITHESMYDHLDNILWLKVDKYEITKNKAYWDSNAKAYDSHQSPEESHFLSSTKQ